MDLSTILFLLGFYFIGVGINDTKADKVKTLYGVLLVVGALFLGRGLNIR